MRISRATVLIVLCSLLPAFLEAQQPAPTPVSTLDPQAVALIQQALSALTNTSTVTDITLVSTAHKVAGSDDETGTGTLKALSTGESRIDLALPSGLASEIRMNNSTEIPQGIWSGPDGVLHQMVDFNMLTDSSWFFPAFALTRILTLPIYQVSYVGSESLEGVQVQHVTVSQVGSGLSPGDANTLQQLSQTEIYLDANSYLPVAVNFNVHPDNNALADVPISLRFSDYQTTDGIPIAFRIQKYINQSLFLDIQVQSANLNSGLSSSAFQVQ